LWNNNIMAARGVSSAGARGACLCHREEPAVALHQTGVFAFRALAGILLLLPRT